MCDDACMRGFSAERFFLLNEEQTLVLNVSEQRNKWWVNLLRTAVIEQKGDTLHFTPFIQFYEAPGVSFRLYNGLQIHNQLWPVQYEGQVALESSRILNMDFSFLYRGVSWFFFSLTTQLQLDRDLFSSMTWLNMQNTKNTFSLSAQFSCSDPGTRGINIECSAAAVRPRRGAAVKHHQGGDQ